LSEYQRPIPIQDVDSEAFWEGCKKHELVIKRCKNCGYYIHYPKPRCPQCQSTDVENATVSGRGTVYSYTMVHTSVSPGFETPYAVALVSLEEQDDVRLMTNIVECPVEEIKIGLPVEVAFQDVLPDVTIPLFRPRKGN
jgi:uncharacterized OB-fold protein